ncbi:DUF817 domain-containing protein [Listeria welshimeri]|nr:DUF817 domain-containing protein [Listeria welshimeri]
MKFFRLLWIFTWKQALCCIFPGIIFLSLALTKLINLPFIPRYDLLLIICLLTQILLIKFDLETWDELKVIMVFHVIGLILEVYKVHMGSWSYPDDGLMKIAGVPLYSGFMYSSIASYICQAWKRFDLKMTNWPNIWLITALCVAIYGNFFTHHFIIDSRWVLIVLVLLLFRKTYVYFKVSATQLKMPLSLSFLCIAFFIYLAENIASFYGAWAYPDQLVAWRPVHVSKITSWYLLVIISIIIVAQLKFIKQKLEKTTVTTKNEATLK